MPGSYELRLRCCLADGSSRMLAYRLVLDGALALVPDSIEPVPGEARR